MDVKTLLFRWGITSWSQDIVTNIPSNAQNSFPIGKILPTDVGFIYGISTYADTLDPDGNQLITTTQAQNLYITFRNGASSFFETIRLDDMLTNFAGSPVVKPQPYMPVNIPVFDLSKSVYYNPSLIVTPAPPALQIVIRLKLWYIQKNQFDELSKEGMFHIHKKANPLPQK